MRLKHLVALVGLCAAAPGCAPLKQVGRTMICEPAAYCMGMDEVVACCRYRTLAEEAWACFQSALPDCRYSEDFADGFKAGFADYLYAGGNGEPPVVPPRPYWKPNFQSPEGQQLMLDWFRGYRHGAAVARESGYRETIVIPASASLPRFTAPPPPAEAKPKPMPPADEILPEPKPLPPPKQLPLPKPLPQPASLPRPAGAVPLPPGPSVAPSTPAIDVAPSLPLPPGPVPPGPPSPLPVGPITPLPEPRAP